MFRKEGMMKKLDVRALGLALGSLWSIVLFTATIWVWIGVDYYDTKGGGTLILLNRFYIGYDVTLRGALISIPYAFISGSVAGCIFGWVYNKLARG